jgi:hypothetical protein
LWHENKNGAEVYVRPARWLPDGTPAAWPIVFLDDVCIEIVKQIKKRALVVETSPDSHHVWLPTNRSLSENERHAEQARLQPLLRSDPASTSGEHFGRLPGFVNHKRNGALVRVARRVDGPVLAPPATTPPSANGGGACASGVGVAASSGSGGLLESLGGHSTDSEREFGYVIGRLRWFKKNGMPVEKEIDRLRRQIADQAASRGKRDPGDYAARTVQAALARL